MSDRSIHLVRDSLRSASRLAVLPLALFALSACDSGSSGMDPAGDAVLVGSVQAAPGAESGAQSASTAFSGHLAEVRTVSAGYVRADGHFQAVAEAQVQTDGAYRIEGVPAGRSDLTVRAWNEAGASVGEALVYGETRSGAELRVPDITARTTAEARVEARLRASGHADALTRAELALLMALEAGAGASATSSAHLDALAQAFSEARATFHAHLGAGGVNTGVNARASASADAVAAFGTALAAGSTLRQAHRAYVRAVVEAWTSSEEDHEAFVLASAAASQRMSAVISSGVDHDATALAALRTALLANVELRLMGAEAVASTNLGLRASVLDQLALVQARIEAATSVSGLRSGIQFERAEMEGRVASAVAASLEGIGSELLALIDLRIRAAAAQSAFWTRLEGAANVEATLAAAAAYGMELEAAIQEWREALPQNAQSSVSAAAAFRLFLALGGGAAIAA
jgi:hypothetical protein